MVALLPLLLAAVENAIPLALPSSVEWEIIVCAPDVDGLMKMPFVAKPITLQCSTTKCPPARNSIPFRPVPTPLKLRFRNTTLSATPAFMIMPLVPLTKIEANAPPPSIVIAFVIVTAPNPPGSITSISPPAIVFEIAPANVLQGAVRLHGFASSPTPDTQVREAWAQALLN